MIILVYLYISGGDQSFFLWGGKKWTSLWVIDSFIQKQNNLHTTLTIPAIEGYVLSKFGKIYSV